MAGAVLLELGGLTACGGGSGGSGGVYYRINATVTGLTGSGLVLQVNGGADFGVIKDGQWMLASGSPGTPYEVTVKTQPSSPAETCTVSNGKGTLSDHDISDVLVACSERTFKVDVVVTGLAGSGLVVKDVANDPGSGVAISQDGTVTLTSILADGGMYAVSVQAQPTNPTQTCQPVGPSGNISGADVTISVVCATNQYKISVSVSGYTGSGLVLSTSGEPDLHISGNGSFEFQKRLASGTSYAVTVQSPAVNPSQLCNVTNGTGTISNADVSVSVSCSTLGNLNGIWGSGPNDIWAVGSGGAAVHFDGNMWTPTWSGTNAVLYGVWGTGQNDVWAVGSSGTVLHYDGSSWTSRGWGYQWDLSGIWGSGTSDVWAVGWLAIYRWNGGSWTNMWTSYYTGLWSAVWGTAPGNVWVAATNGFCGMDDSDSPSYGYTHWNGGGFEGPCREGDLFGVWASGPSDAWFVGDGFYHVTHSGTTFTWASISTGTSGMLRGVWGSAPSDIWAVGDSGTAVHYTGGTQATASKVASTTLRGVWGSSANNVWAVGDSGTIVRLAQ